MSAMVFDFYCQEVRSQQQAKRTSASQCHHFKLKSMPVNDKEKENIYVILLSICTYFIVFLLTQLSARGHSPSGRGADSASLGAALLLRWIDHHLGGRPLHL